MWVRLALCLTGLILTLSCAAFVLYQNHHPNHRHGWGGAISDWIKSPNRFPTLVNWWIWDRVIFPSGDQYVDAGTSWSDPDARALIDSAKSGHGTVWTVRFVAVSESRGLWGRTSVRHSVQSQIFVYPSGPPEPAGFGTPHYQASIPVRAVAIGSAIGRGRCPFPESMGVLSSVDEWKRVRQFWSGYAINTATLLGLGMFLWFAPLAVCDAWRAWRYRRAGGCAHCGYDLRGLPHGAPACPECGNAPRTSR